MLDDAHLGLRCILTPASCQSTLRPVLCVIKRSVITRQPQHGGSGAHTNTRFIHHVEHAAQAFTRFTDQIAHRTCCSAWCVFTFAKIEQGIGGTTPAKFVIQSSQSHVIAFTSQSTLCVDHFFRYDKKRYAPCTCNQFTRSIGDFGQYEMDDVLGQLMVTRRNPHFVAFEAVARTQLIRLPIIIK